MPRKLLIFGNGLGMAINPDHFSLANALEAIWSNNNVISSIQKDLIGRCIDSAGAPESEDELDKLHLAVTSCEILNKIGRGRRHWLTDDGQSFPVMTAQYIRKVATLLHNYVGELPGDFINPLVGFVKETKSHVATLNYDKLLYNAFLDNAILDGYNGYLIDGMLSTGFDSNHLVRRFSNDFGYYLHLHGSPLFINENGRIHKLSRDQLTLGDDRVGQHVVLTHVKHKPSVIAASEALSAYWDYLKFSMFEAEEIILFGYSGLDTHLNHLMKPYLENKNIRVVEWSEAGEERERATFWRSKLGESTTLIKLDNVLNFSEW